MCVCIGSHCTHYCRLPLQYTVEACILSGLPRDPGNPAGITGFRICCFINPVIGTGRELIPTGPVGSGSEHNHGDFQLVALPTKEQKHHICSLLSVSQKSFDLRSQVKRTTLPMIIQCRKPEHKHSIHRREGEKKTLLTAALRLCGHWALPT